MGNNKDIPPEIKRHLRNWRVLASLLQTLLIILAVSGIVSALVVAGFVELIGPLWTRALAFISAACFSIISGLNLTSLASNHRAAWRHLNAASMKYKMVKGFNEDQLISAYEKGEEIIGHVILHPEISDRIGDKEAASPSIKKMNAS